MIFAARSPSQLAETHLVQEHLLKRGTYIAITSAFAGSVFSDTCRGLPSCHLYSALPLSLPCLVARPKVWRPQCSASNIPDSFSLPVWSC